ncbi:MAG TPA: lamin tail domain-containing protein [Candidatus Limnocylindria bacterium]|nr:lamin tail domain-containing protein [Candidatus Limnocylindria bacterium]
MRFPFQCVLSCRPAGQRLGLALLLLLAAWLPARAGSILREVYQGIGGNAISDLTNNPVYPDHPTLTNFVTDLFESPSNFDENYGQRMHGYITPPVTGNYTFWLATDDNGALYLSTDSDPANAQLIASVPDWAGVREWTKFPQQQSAPVKLNAGQNYYIIALEKEGGGGDNLAVRWLRPDGVDEGPIPATYLLPYGTSFGPPIITQEPTNTTVIEGQIATFSMAVKNLDLVTYTWRRNGTLIPGVSGAILNYGPVTLDDNNAVFGASLTNKLGGTNSTTATLTVLPDTTKPTIASVINLGASKIQLVFSEPVSGASGLAIGNYQVDGGVTVSTAAYGADAATVVLTTSPMTFGTTYKLTVNGVQDRAQTPNTILSGSSISLLALEFVSQDIGTGGGSIQRIGTGAYDVKGGGADINGVSDQFQFAWEQRSGNFDLQVRVADAVATDPFLHAGLMARGSLDANAAFAAIFGSSLEVGSFFESRASVGTPTTTASLTYGFPVNYPQTWLRLRRVGSVFTGFGSLDGQKWVQLGGATITLPTQIYVGLALSSGNAQQVSTAQFRDYGPIQSAVVGTYTPTHEPLAPSNRRTGLVFSEIMYHPKLTAGATANLEFVEIYNADTIFEDISGWRLAGGIAFEFPPGTVIPAGAFLTIAADPDALKAASGAANIVGPYFGALNNAGDTVRLEDSFGAVKLEVTYSPNAPWPVAADGAGHSLVLANPSYGENDPRAWDISEAIGGTPGRQETIGSNPQSGVVINEFLAHTDEPQVDYIELYNHTLADVDLSGCFISDKVDTNRFRIPDGTIIPKRGFLVFDQNQLGFRLNAAGETIYLASSNATRVIDTVRYTDQENGVASGRSPDGAPTIRRLVQPTPGAANAPWRLSDIVINELMYDPISGDDNDEYIELYNQGTNTVSLNGWRLEDAVSYKFADGLSLAPGAFLVVAKDRAQLMSNYTQLSVTNTVGDYSGSLKNSGEHLALTMPDDITSTNSFGEVSTNKIHIIVSEVTYGSGGRWGKYSGGGGSSLELTDPRADLLQPSSWADSDESQKGQWSTFTVTGLLDNGQDGFPPNRLHIGRQGMGEAMVDEVEVFKTAGANLVANNGFESGATGWSFFGNHSLSAVDTSGAFAGTHALHVRSQDDSDTGINSIRTSLTTSLNSGDTATIRAKARWIAGAPEILFRLSGGWLELPCRLAVPKNLGTPGLPNSRLVTNAGPAIYDVTHTPALPRVNEAVVVSARVADADGLSSVTLRVRLDSTSAATTTVMRDDGTGGDAIAGDGIYSATITGRSSGTLVGFKVIAVDAAATPATSTFPSTNLVPVALPSAEGYIRWDDPIPGGNFAHYHMWNSQASENQRSNPLNNTYRDATLVYGGFRVIYNAGFRDKGSPYHGGGGSFAVINAADEPLLGATDRVFRSTGNGGAESTGLRSQLSSWLGKQMGIPYLHSHYMQLWRNGGQFYNLTQDEETPTGDYAQHWFPSSDEGDFYKIAIWFEFQDDNSNFNGVSATLEPFKTTGGVYKLARYRFNWQTRGYGGTANNYTNIFNLVTAANDPSAAYVPGLLGLADLNEWMRVFAYHRVLGNWDSWSFSVGQNMYAYKLPSETWKLLPWDIDFTFGDGNGPTDALWGGQDPVVNRMYDTPVFRRMLWRAFEDAVNGPMDPATYGPVIAARRATLVKNGLGGLADPSGVANYIVQRRAYIQTQITANDVAQFAITSNNGNNFTSSTPTATLTGRAPFAVADIAVNGTVYPATWTDQNSFSIAVPLTGASTAFTLTGLDGNGTPVPGATDTITVNYAGAIQQAQDFVVINEIHYNPAEAGASFVELFNNSTSTLFDLSGDRLEGVGYTFPDGSLVPPGGFLVLVKDRVSFGAAYGSTIPVFDQFSGSLDNGGETLRLIQPLGQGGTNDLVISDVRYDNHLPWPTNADGFGPSLQLVDPSRGSFHVGNWAVTATNAVNRVTPGRANSVKATLTPFPGLWLNEVLPNNVAGPVDNAGEHDPFIELYNSGTNSIALAAYALTDDYANLAKWHFPAGTSIAPQQFLVIWADGQTDQSTATDLHTSFRLNPTNSGLALVRVTSTPIVQDYLDYKQLPAGRSFGSFPDGEPRNRRSFYHVTAGTTNDPTFPEIKVTLNEFMADNTSTIFNPVGGKADDWFELFNAGSSAVDLTSYRLTENLTNSTEFTVPPGYVIPAGGFLLVWADNNAKANNPTNTGLHVNFKLSKAGQQLGLFGPDGNLVDGFTFGAQTNDISQGRYPDGGEAPLVSFESPTPGGPNVVAGGNLPPVLTAIPPQTVTEQTTLTFTAVATDPDAGQKLAYSLGVDAPAGATIDADTGVFTWTPSEEQGPASYNFALRALDNGTPPRSAIQRVTVTVSEANRPPVLDPVADHAINEGSLFSFTASATDPDVPANKLTYSLDAGFPVGATIDANTGVFSWTPAESQGPGVYPLTVRVSDGTVSDAKSFTLTVNEVDNPPVFDAIAPQTVDEGKPFTLTVHAADPDSPPAAVTYSLEGNLPSGINIETVSGIIQWTPSEAQGPATYSIIVRATESDAGGLSSVQSFGLTVNEVNQAPVLSALKDITVEEGSVVTFTATATDSDLPKQALTYALAAGAPVGATVDPNSGLFVWSTPDDTGATTNSVTVTVTDNGPGNLTDTKSFTVITVPKFRAVINEIMYHPAAANGAYVELFNPSTVTTQDLGGLLLAGENLRFDFPAGTKLAPGKFLIVAQNKAAFGTAYGGTIPVLGEWSGQLDRFGTSLGIFDTSQHVLTEVDFRASLPWPTNADAGAALQLIDARRDSSRVGNWSANSGPQWQHVVQSGTASSSTLYMYLESVGDVYLDDVKLVAGNDADVGENLLVNGDFESDFPGPFAIGSDGNMAQSARSTTVKHAGNASLHLVATAGGTTRNSSVYQDLATALTQNAPYTLSFWYLPSSSGGNLTLRLSGSGIRSTTDIATGATTVTRFTPGTTNSVVAALPEFPPLWINEVLPHNTGGILDSTGAPEPWLELVNRGSLPVSLDGWSLANTYTNLGQWTFPAGTVIAPGQFLLVFSDGQPGEATPTELHTNFRLDPTNGVLALSRPQLGVPAVVDYLDYNVPTANQSFGRDPDTFPAGLKIFTTPTPAAANPSAIANRAPVLAAIGNQTAYVGQPLSFLVTASDPDPGQTLTYTFPAASPVGATLLGSPAQFSWTPTADQVGVANVVVRVTDNGIPPLSDDATVNINVLAPVTPAFGASVGTSGGVTLAWAAQVGLRYRVEVRDSLSTPWQTLTELVATSTSAMATDNLTGHTERYYRLVIP